MKLVIVFVLFLMISCEAEKSPMQKCYDISLPSEGPSSSSQCGYIEDAVRCGIRDSKLTAKTSESNATVQDKDLKEIKDASNKYFKDNNCPETFDKIFNEVKARPELLVVQACIENALIQSQGNLSEACNYVEKAVVCGMKVLSADEDNASENDLQFGRSIAPRYLTRYNCNATFDTIMERFKNSGPTASPIGWLTAVMAASILKYATVF